MPCWEIKLMLYFEGPSLRNNFLKVSWKWPCSLVLITGKMETVNLVKIQSLVFTIEDEFPWKKWTPMNIYYLYIHYCKLYSELYVCLLKHFTFCMVSWPAVLWIKNLMYQIIWFFPGNSGDYLEIKWNLGTS